MNPPQSLPSLRDVKRSAEMGRNDHEVERLFSNHDTWKDTEMEASYLATSLLTIAIHSERSMLSLFSFHSRLLLLGRLYIHGHLDRSNARRLKYGIHLLKRQTMSLREYEV